MQSFLAAYNGLTTTLARDVKIDSGSSTAGVLQGDSTAVALQRQLRNMLGAPSSASSVFTTLSQVGLELQADGTLKANDTKLNAAMGNIAEMKKLFTATDLSGGGQGGIARRLASFGDAALGVDGLLTGRTDGLNASQKTNRKSEDDMNTRLSSTEARMRAQYSALDTKLASLNALSLHDAADHKLEQKQQQLIASSAMRPGRRPDASRHCPPFRSIPPRPLALRGKDWKPGVDKKGTNAGAKQNVQQQQSPRISPAASHELPGVNASTAVEGALPHKLVSPLYQALTSEMTAARGAIARADIAEKGRAISHAVRIVEEGLLAPLDVNAGGTIAAGLRDSYRYLIQRKTIANLKSDDAALAECAGLIETLREGWDAIADQVDGPARLAS
ncbi:MAG: flagellar filament capping protein FliD [Caldimonas sp.]